MPSFICPFCSLNCSGLLPRRSGKSEFDLNWLCKAGKTALQQVLSTSHSPEIAGRPVSWEDGFTAAAQTIRNARFPLVVLSGGVSCEAHQQGLQLVEKIHAALDTVATGYSSILPRVVPETGFQTSTIGEVTAAKQACLFWGVDVAERIPCPDESISTALHQKNSLEINYHGKQGWGSPKTIEITPGNTVSLLQNMRLALRYPDQVFAPVVRQLADHFQSVESGLVFIGKDFLQEGVYAAIELTRLLDDLWNTHPWRVITLALEPNAAGTAEVLTTNSGFSRAIFVGNDKTSITASPAPAQVLIEKKMVDAVVSIGSAQWLTIPEGIPSVVIEAQKPQTSPTLWLPCGQTGIHTMGKVVRFDGITLQLDAYLPAEILSAEKVIGWLLEGVSI